MSNTVISLRCVAASLLCSLTAAAVSAEDPQPPRWPQFRGVDAAGVAPAGRFPHEFAPDKNVLWKAETPPGVSSPSIWNDRIFLTAHVPQSGKLETLCLDRRTGAALWRAAVEVDKIENVHQVSSPANATPASDGQRVYVYFASLGMLCYDFDGKELWRKPMPLVDSPFGSGTSPVVAGDLVLLNRDTFGDPQEEAARSHIVALDARTGETVWRTPRPGSFVKYSTPVVWSRGDVRQALLIGSHRLTAYDIADGREAWHVENLPPQACATPVIAGDRVFITATGMFGEPETYVGIPEYDKVIKDHDKNSDGLIGLDELPGDLLLIERRATGGAGNSPLRQFIGGGDADGDKKLSREEWDKFRSDVAEFMSRSEPGIFSIEPGGRGNVSATHVKWKQTRGVAEVPSPLVYQGRLYTVRNGGIVHCRDVADGRERFAGRLGAIGGYYASPVAGDGKVYFASDRGVITVLKASDELEVLARNDLVDRIMATPALVDNTLYVRTDRHLYAFSSAVP